MEARQRRKLALIGAKLALAVAVLWLVIRGLDVKAAIASIRSLSPYEWVLILSLPLLQAVLLGQRWRVISNVLGYSMPFAESVVATLISFFFSQGLPASIGGDAFRIWYQRRNGIPVADAARIVIIDRLIGFLTLVTLTGISLVMLLGRIGDRRGIILLGLTVAGILVGVGVLMLLVRKEALRPITREFTGIMCRIKNAYNWCHECVSSARRVTAAQSCGIIFLAAIVHFLTIFLIFVAASNSIHITFLDCFAAVTPALLLAYLPISIAGWGVREAAVVAGFALYGVPVSISLPVSILTGLAVLAVSLLGGVAWMWGGYKRQYSATELGTSG